MLNTFFKECFISGLKEEICARILMTLPTTWLEATHIYKKSQNVVTTHIKKPNFIPHPHPTNPYLPSPPLEIQKLTWAKWQNANLNAFVTIMNTNIFLGTNVKRIKFVWTFQKMMVMLSFNNLCLSHIMALLLLVNYMWNPKSPPHAFTRI
jgi:hypothetical protein